MRGLSETEHLWCLVRAIVAAHHYAIHCAHRSWASCAVCPQLPAAAPSRALVLRHLREVMVEHHRLHVLSAGDVAACSAPICRRATAALRGTHRRRRPTYVESPESPRWAAGATFNTRS